VSPDRHRHILIGDVRGDILVPRCLIGHVRIRQGRLEGVRDGLARCLQLGWALPLLLVDRADQALSAQQIFHLLPILCARRKSHGGFLQAGIVGVRYQRYVHPKSGIPRLRRLFPHRRVLGMLLW
jgi:hypothetical protein